MTESVKRPQILPLVERSNDDLCEKLLSSKDSQEFGILSALARRNSYIDTAGETVFRHGFTVKLQKALLEGRYVDKIFI